MKIDNLEPNDNMDLISIKNSAHESSSQLIKGLENLEKTKKIETNENVFTKIDEDLLFKKILINSERIET